MSPKAAETRSLLRLMDDTVHMAKQLSQLMNVSMKIRLFTDLRLLLESMLVKNVFRLAQTEDNLVMYEEGEFKIRNLVTKKDKEAEKEKKYGRDS